MEPTPRELMREISRLKKQIMGYDQAWNGRAPQAPGTARPSFSANMATRAQLDGVRSFQGYVSANNNAQLINAYWRGSENGDNDVSDGCVTLTAQASLTDKNGSVVAGADVPHLIVSFGSENLMLYRVPVAMGNGINLQLPGSRWIVDCTSTHSVGILVSAMLTRGPKAKCTQGTPILAPSTQTSVNPSASYDVIVPAFATAIQLQRGLANSGPWSIELLDGANVNIGSQFVDVDAPLIWSPLPPQTYQVQITNNGTLVDTVCPLFALDF